MGEACSEVCSAAKSQLMYESHSAAGGLISHNSTMFTVIPLISVTMAVFRMAFYTLYSPPFRGSAIL